jgi:hypothetical protein
MMTNGTRNNVWNCVVPLIISRMIEKVCQLYTLYIIPEEKKVVLFAQSGATVLCDICMHSPLPHGPGTAAEHLMS